jgi:hypothetical protein
MVRKVPEHDGSETWRDRITIGVVGLLFVAVVFVSFDLDGGRGRLSSSVSSAPH